MLLKLALLLSLYLLSCNCQNSTTYYVDTSNVTSVLQTTMDGDVVVLANGTYSSLVVNTTITLVGSGASIQCNTTMDDGVSIVQGNVSIADLSISNCRYGVYSTGGLFNLSNVNVSYCMTGVLINMSATEGSGNWFSGKVSHCADGAIRTVNQATLLLVGAVIDANTRVANGAAAAGVVEWIGLIGGQNITFSNNDNDAEFGGAIYIDGQLSIVNSVFVNNKNTNPNGHGGAISGSSSAILTFSNTDFVANQAANGKSVYLDSNNNTIFSSCKFENHHSTSSSVSSVVVVGNAQFVYSTFFNNTGADKVCISGLPGSNYTFAALVFVNNTATAASGTVAFFSGGSVLVNLINTTCDQVIGFSSATVAVSDYSLGVAYTCDGSSSFNANGVALTCDGSVQLTGTCNTTSPCTPSCGGADCGADDGCGGKCNGYCTYGTCNSSYACECTPSCTGASCGNSDGCGGYCVGSCTYGTCNATTLQCDCVKTCTSASTCGDADGCGGYCNGTCSGGPGYRCISGACSCTPSCPSNVQCGASDGCGSVCSTGICANATFLEGSPAKNVSYTQRCISGVCQAQLSCGTGVKALGLSFFPETAECGNRGEYVCETTVATGNLFITSVSAVTGSCSLKTDCSPTDVGALGSSVKTCCCDTQLCNINLKCSTITIVPLLAILIVSIILSILF
eukprot:TRINITY_DN10559_c0_g1_i1.p1 TRINITY_DN10559_c0_g1~~TRINITY_DN10559_c0_g1_i1.p1  ORF type:complete len:681 (+),score=137.74 TRINITY_DN10559_c0_g1_i1:37-2079(+)